MAKSKDHASPHIAQRVEAVDSLEFFPSPPWSVRALVEEVIGKLDTLKHLTVWEPAAGEGHCAEILREYFAWVGASDIFDYRRGYAIGAFVEPRTDIGNGKSAHWADARKLNGVKAAPLNGQADWIITNPPFNLLEAFLERALKEAKVGVSFLAQLRILEGTGRYERIFHERKPTRIDVFSERCAMLKGTWHPKNSTTTAYAWFTWLKADMGRPASYSPLYWIPPGAQKRHTRDDDEARFAGPPPAKKKPKTTARA